MRCSRVVGYLGRYLDGDLPERLNRPIAAHLARCESCRSEETVYRRAVRALDMVRHPVSIDLWADFSRRLQTESVPRPSPWRHLWQPGLAALAATIVVSLVARSAPTPPVSLAAVPPAPVMQLAEKAEAPGTSASGAASARR